MLKHLRRAFVLILFLTAPAVSGAAEPFLQLDKILPQGLSPEQARRLLVLVLTHEGYQINKPTVFIDGPFLDDQGNPAIPGYVHFGIGYDNPKDLAVSSWGLFAVSASSGEVLEINLCKTYLFPALRHIQGQIRAATRISEADEREQRKGTGCD